MAKNIRIDWKGYKGFKQLRNDPAIVADIAGRAQKIANAAGSGFESSSQTGRNRARASVITGDYKARKDQAEDNALMRAIDAGRL